MRQREDAAKKRYAGGPVKKDSAPAKADKDTPKVADAPVAEQSAQANSEGAAAAGAPSMANMEDVMKRHSREHDEMSGAHMKQMKDMLARHQEERAGLIGGTGEADTKDAA